MIDINELRDGVSKFGGGYLTDSGWAALIDRLEAAESEALEEARLNGMGSEREAALMAKLEAAEKERDALRTELNEIRYGVAVTHDTIKALRAKIEQMERQEPARLVTPTAYRWRRRGSVMWQYGELTEETARLVKEHNHEVQPLYALPGAQPAPSLASGDVSLISEGKTQPAPSVPDDILRDAMRYRFLRAAKHIPISTEAARDPIVYDAAIDAAMLAAAPEAKP